MADDERRRLLKRIEALEEASAAIQRELASVKDAVEGLTEEPSGQPARETKPAFSGRVAAAAKEKGPGDSAAEEAREEPGGRF